ncbi:MAG TPA: hypothetical protein IAC38_04350 [Candidatus Caccovivens faecavium]|nr:hypothetical protein [Candidatus Caccovivens faecavium]
MSEHDKMVKVIRFALVKIGCKINHLGFQYLCYAVELVIMNPGAIHNLLKDVYQKISDEYHVGNRMTVHSSIRNVIELTYETGSFLEINKFFKTEIYSLNDKPTCGEIIGLVAEYYTLKLYKSEEIFKDF